MVVIRFDDLQANLTDDPTSRISDVLNMSCRTLPMPQSLKDELKRLREKSASEELLVFHTRNGTPFSDTNLLHKYLKPAGRKLGMPWLNWHTLRRTHATLLQHAGATLREAQAQLGHSKMSHHPRNLHNIHSLRAAEGSRKPFGFGDQW